MGSFDEAFKRLITQSTDPPTGTFYVPVADSQGNVTGMIPVGDLARLAGQTIGLQGNNGVGQATATGGWKTLAGNGAKAVLFEKATTGFFVIEAKQNKVIALGWFCSAVPTGESIINFFANFTASPLGIWSGQNQYNLFIDNSTGYSQLTLENNSTGVLEYRCAILAVTNNWR